MVKVARSHPQYVVLDCDDAEVEAVAEYLRDLVLGDASPLTCRSYAYDLLRWFRLLWNPGPRRGHRQPTPAPGRPVQPGRAGG
ncbi:MAG: hypothetical protein LC799_31350, partial [Actinobacteria bacterium]|nr:hypothetical protein [Actinomycetota bacterium]